MFWQDGVPFCTSSKWQDSEWITSNTCVFANHSSRQAGRNAIQAVLPKTFQTSPALWRFPHFLNQMSFSPNCHTSCPHLCCLLFAYVVLFWLFNISIAPPKHTYASTHITMIDRNRNVYTCAPQFRKLSRKKLIWARLTSLSLGFLICTMDSDSTFLVSWQGRSGKGNLKKKWSSSCESSVSNMS